ncbi:MMPL family transporter [Arthrobacter halodurans]|uniref:Efflux RND transporter permease subunit n=1 Tax=Arthrobacter halodurans TaxID=516699 RepID=A0ABV4UM96_9MICC
MNEKRSAVDGRQTSAAPHASESAAAPEAAGPTEAAAGAADRTAKHRAGGGPGALGVPRARNGSGRRARGGRGGGTGRGPGRGTKAAIGRALAAVAIVLLWLGVAGVGGPTFGKLDEVQSNDQASFLPASAEATRALEWQDRFRDSSTIPAVVVVESESALDPASLAPAVDGLGAVAAVNGDIVGPIPSEDGNAVQLIVPLDSGADVEAAVAEMRALLAGSVPAGAMPYVTGPAGFTADLVEAFSGIDGILLGVALAAVLVILLLVYRSLLLPITVLFTSVAALCAAILAVFYMAKAGWISLDGQSQGILSILVIGAATDYALLYVARFREALSHGEHRFTAVATAMRKSAEPILASAGTVTVGLLCLVFSDLNSNKALGPIAASGIVFSVLAALTLLPALLGLFGRAAFWPFIPKTVPVSEEPSGLWARVASFVGRRPRPVWIATTLLLAAGCLGLTQLQASGVPQSELVLGETQSATGQDVLAEHFDAGSGSPAYAVVAAEDGEALLETVRGVEGVGSAYLQAEDGGPALTAADQSAGTDAQAGPPPGVGTGPDAGAAPADRPAQEIEGRVLISITLEDAADSAAAADTVLALRDVVHAGTPDGLVGGVSATALDTNTTAKADLVKIIPLVLTAILLILMLLLRSVLAPVLLIATTLLSYGTAMGVSAWVFDGVFGFPGADPSVPLFGFVFLVALGVDYNIFLMTRVREEALKHGTRDGIRRGLAVTGGVITSAGVVLAATFAALGVIPIMFLVQLGFIVAFGVLLDTLVVRTLLVPALAHDIGRRIWWPSRLGREDAGAPSAPAPGPSEDAREREAVRA